MTTNKLLQIDSTGKQVAGVGVPSGTDINGAGKVVSIQGVTADFTSTPPATGQLGIVTSLAKNKNNAKKVQRQQRWRHQ